jgi:UDP-N-acetylmuramate--alanine ligase
MPLLDSSDARPIHFVGIAGAGMSALAELFLRRGVAITGCDANPDSAADLQRLGVVVEPHNPAHVDGARALVVTSAMPKDHPELVRAREHGIPVIRRAEALGEVTVGRELVGIAGTHGKTTTTVMTATALAAAGRDPTALVGGRVGAWEGNLLAGGDRLYVVEADEYDRSFLALTPTVAVVTNIEADHLDIYTDLADIKGAFAQFVRGARNIVLCADDPGANSLATPSATEIVRYGFGVADARLVARRLESRGGGSAFDVVFDDELLGRVTLSVPGSPQCAQRARRDRQRSGTRRRLRRDDTRTRDLHRRRASLSATRRDRRRMRRRRLRASPDRDRRDIGRRRARRTRTAASWPPFNHISTRERATSRRSFGTALAAADAVFLTEIYPAREQPVAGVTSSLIVDALSAAGGALAWRGERTALADALRALVTDGDLVLTIGAGDITKTGTELLERLGRTP